MENTTNNKKGFLTADEALSSIRGLATAQGFYGRLYEELTEDEETMEAFKKYIEQSKFSDVVDFIIDLES